MPLKRYFHENCPDCGKKQTGRNIAHSRIWWIPCPCKNIPGCPVDYPRLVNIDQIIKPARSNSTDAGK